MSLFRCPKHDYVFETSTDHRKPGAQADRNFPAHPIDGHPDCPLCQDAAVAELTGVAVSKGVFAPNTEEKPGRWRKIA